MSDLSTLDPATIDCKVTCANGCVLEERCPHRDAAKAAVAYVMNTDWDSLMKIAESRATDPLSRLENYRVSGQE